MVGRLLPNVFAGLRRVGESTPESAAIVLKDRLVVGEKQRRQRAAQNTLRPEEWRALPQWLDHAGAHLQVANGHLIFVADGIGAAKIVVELSLNDVSSEVVTAFRTEDTAIAGMVKGGL